MASVPSGRLRGSGVFGGRARHGERVEREPFQPSEAESFLDPWKHIRNVYILPHFTPRAYMRYVLKLHGRTGDTI
jgi:hypothetical protein